MGLRTADRHLVDPARVAVRRRRGSGPDHQARLGRGCRRDRARSWLRTKRIRTEDTLGDGLVLPGAHRSDRRPGGESSPVRRLARVRHGGPRHPLRLGRTVGHRVRDRRGVTGVLGHRRLRHCHRSLGLDQRAPTDDGAYLTGIVYPQRDRLSGRRTHVVHSGGRDPGGRHDLRKLGCRRSFRAAIRALRLL